MISDSRTRAWQAAGWTALGAISLGVMIALGGPAQADSDEPILKIFKPTDKDFSLYEQSDGAIHLAAPLEPPFVGGLARLVKGESKFENWTYWYSEVIYVIRGRGKFTAAAPPFLESETYEVGPGAFFSIPTSTRISIEAVSDEPFEFFYAVPMPE